MLKMTTQINQDKKKMKWKLKDENQEEIKTTEHELSINCGNKSAMNKNFGETVENITK